MLDRLSKDFDALERAFAGGEGLGPLVGVSGGLADPHDGGRSVAIARFGSGTRIVYKPKPLAVDRHFQDLLRWLTAEGFSPAFRPLTIVDRDSYGWVEFVSPEECQSPEEVARFYERTGGYLALLYVMDATDFHAGNVIASGEHPVLIDLEALFHPHRSAPVTDHQAPADLLAARSVRNSVLRIGLLPERVWANSEHDGVDISGLGAPDGQMTPHAIAGWEDSGTDTMHVVRRRRAIEADLNRPILDGQAVDATAHSDAILRGFRSAYSMLVARRDVLLSPDGPLRRFEHDPVAVFLRSSRTYRRLLRESYHPDVLRDALDRDRLFDLLWAEVPDDPDLMRVISSERDALWNGDIPCFAARPDSRDLWVDGREAVADFFPEPSLSAVRRIVDQLGEADCARQSFYIAASFASLPNAERRRPSHPGVRSESPVDQNRLLHAALAVGNRLEQLVIRGANDASWIGLSLGRHRAWCIARAGIDLDAGIPGIALFLAYLGAVTGHESSSALARSALTTMRGLLTERSPTRLGIGGFDGLGGVIYVLSHLAILWGLTDLVNEADTLASLLPELIEKDDELTVFGGAAGCILALRSLRACRPSERLTAIAIQCGHHLLRAARRSADGIGWPEPFKGRNHRSGMAFGTAGIAHALLELHAWTGIEGFRALALDAIDSARSRSPQRAAVDQESGRQPDRERESRGVDSGDGSSLGESAGLSRLYCAPDMLMNPDTRADIVAVAQAIRDRGLGGDHSLFHGDLGRIEFLARSAAMLEDEDLAREARAMAATVVAEIEQHGWQCGTPLGVETPGLLVGLAGIGYGLLRTAQPDLVPSVLALEPPLPARRAYGG